MAISSHIKRVYSIFLPFVTGTLLRFTGVLFALFALIAVSCAAYVYVVEEQEKTIAIGKRAYEARNNALSVELVGLQKQIQIDVVQIQQYVSEFAATRGQDGHDAGLSKAEKVAKQFTLDIAAARKAAEALESPDLTNRLVDVERRFPAFYGRGVEMAKSYAAQGTSAGNQLMPSFDKSCDEMLEQLNTANMALDATRQRRSLETAIANKKLDALREKASAIVASSVVITVIACLFGVLLLGKWVVQPLGWITFCFKQLAGGNTNYELKEADRTDEIGQLGKAYSEFRRVTIERRKHNRESRLLAELNEWLQCCKSLEELYQIVSEFLTILLPNCAGSLYIYANSRDVLDCAKVWNGAEATTPMQPDECWGLRRGRVFTHGESEIEFNCSHVEPSTAGDYCCIPIVAHGDTIGMLHLQFGDDRSSKGEQARREAIAGQRRLGLVCAEQISMAIANVRLRDQLRDQSIRDALTGLFNRRYLLESCRREFSRAMRAHQSVSLLSIDVDHFKKFNDNHGHDAGDTVLRAVGQCLEDIIREEDIACRFGGEEFVVALPGASPAIAARRAEELRSKIELLEVPYLGMHLPRITVSIGVAAFPNCGDNPQVVLRAADAALYKAKDAGRNCVELSPMINVTAGKVAEDALDLQRSLATAFNSDRMDHDEEIEPTANVA
jgi:diguanylate cyclase (GGDEF)-like protein